MQIYTHCFKGFLVCIVLMFFGTQSVYADIKSETADSAADTVKKLYRDYAWEAIGLEDIGLLDQPQQKLEEYFEHSLTILIVKDRKCREKTHDICHLDSNIIFASQDPAAVDLKIIENENGEVVARFKYPSTREVVEIKYILKRTKSGWRIHDIEYGKGLLTLLERLK